MPHAGGRPPYSTVALSWGRLPLGRRDCFKTFEKKKKKKARENIRPCGMLFECACKVGGNEFFSLSCSRIVQCTFSRPRIHGKVRAAGATSGSSSKDIVAG